MFDSKAFNCSLLILGFLATCLLPCWAPVCFASDSSVESVTFTSRVTLYSPINKTYTSKFLSLNLTAFIGLGIRCKITYSLDNKPHQNLTLIPQHPEQLRVLNKVAANTTLPELTQGTHNLTIQVVCSTPSSTSPISKCPLIPECTNTTLTTATWTDTIQFSIKTTEQQIPEFSPQTLLILTILATTIIVVTKNHKKNKPS